MLNSSRHHKSNANGGTSTVFVTSPKNSLNFPNAHAQNNEEEEKKDCSGSFSSINFERFEQSDKFDWQNAAAYPLTVEIHKSHI